MLDALSIINNSILLFSMFNSRIIKVTRIDIFTVSDSVDARP